MSKIEINEIEWYFRDFLFKNHNRGVSQLQSKTIPNNMIETYLRYRNAESRAYFLDFRNRYWKI